LSSFPQPPGNACAVNHVKNSMGEKLLSRYNDGIEFQRNSLHSKLIKHKKNKELEKYLNL